MILMIIEKVIRFIKENNMLSEGEHVVLGVSGGADSMCLLLVLMEISKIYNIKLTAVHVHHGIRGKEADEDKLFVENFCKDNHIDFVGFDYDIPAMAKESGLSTEEAGRIARYNAFEEVRVARSADKIAVAHNVGDDVETILLNMCRGTGISGMSGIKPVRGHIIRPVMCLTRPEIEEFLKEKHVAYRTDSTNLANDYTRNKIRNVLIPYLNENINAKADVHIGTLGAMIGDIDDFINEEAEKSIRDIIISEEYSEERCQVEADVTKLNGLHRGLKSAVVRKLLMKVAGKLKDITINHITSVISIASGETGKSVNLPYNVIAVKYPSSLIIRKELSTEDIKESKFVEINAIPGTYEIAGNCLKVSYDNCQNVKILEKTYTKWLNCDILEAGLCIRTRKNGDYIVVNDQGGRKKLKDYFIDLKIPREQRDDVLLLADGSHILWVIGHRISEAAKVNETTEHIIKAEFIKNISERETEDE